MTIYIYLTEEAKEICRQNYRTTCGTCPLRPACVETGSSHLTVEKLNDETLRINNLAEDIKGEGRGEV